MLLECRDTNVEISGATLQIIVDRVNIPGTHLIMINIWLFLTALCYLTVPALPHMSASAFFTIHLTLLRSVIIRGTTNCKILFSCLHWTPSPSTSPYSTHGQCVLLLFILCANFIVFYFILLIKRFYFAQLLFVKHPSLFSQKENLLWSTISRSQVCWSVVYDNCRCCILVSWLCGWRR